YSCMSPNYFFFHGSVFRRDLHSFPTRRSSDLCGKSTLLNLVAGTLIANHGEVNVCARDMGRLTASGRDHHRGENIGYIFQSFNRSEEHTSELQSRENLVCRLLLEKKKT